MPITNLKLSNLNTSIITKDCSLILPKNSGLEKYREQLETLTNNKIIVRAEDVPFFVEELTKTGTNCIGLTGEDLFLEYKYKNALSKINVIQKIPWTDKSALFGKPALCLLGKTQLTKESTVAINKKYYFLAEEYFSKTIQPKNKIYLNGSTETAFEKGISDFVIDIVYSGKSAKTAGLEIIEKIIESNIVLLGVKK